MNKRTPLTLFLLLVVIICSSCFSSEMASLGDRYIYRDLGRGDSFIFNSEYGPNPYTFSPTKPDDYDTYEASEKKYFETLIPCTIKDYSYNDTFIIAAQIIRPNCGFDAVREDALKTGRAVNYWIVLKETRQTIGPLSVEEYHIKRQEYNVPESLSLREN